LGNYICFSNDKKFLFTFVRLVTRRFCHPQRKAYREKYTSRTIERDGVVPAPCGVIVDPRLL